MSLKKTYIQYGVPSIWAQDYESKNISANTFRQTSKKNLVEKYRIPQIQISFVKDCLTRKPIDEKVFDKLLENNRFVCCWCKGTKSDAYIIHHIEEYSLTQNNKYENLAVLCPNDHDLAHREGAFLANKIPKEQIREAKKNWEKEVKKGNKEIASTKPISIKNVNWRNINIFKELQSYTENDKEYFWGRDTEIDELLNKIHKYNIIGLFGESGTGKTSLINAGFIPKMKSEDFIIVSIRCLDEPIKRIREELHKKLTDKKLSPQSIDNLFSADTFPHLMIQLKSIVEKENIKIVIIIDQFEELFTRAREVDREYLSKGITEALIGSSKRNVYFLLSLIEDYIGELWDWSHIYNLEGAWIHQYRIKRFDEGKAFDVITKPLHKLGIKTDNEFINQLIYELKNIGDGLIYPPYLQILCTELFEEYKIQNPSSKPSIVFGANLYYKTASVEEIIADYLSESMLRDLTEEERLLSQNILDLLTGSEGLRAFLSIEDMCRYLAMTKDKAQHIVEHLIKKKIVHPVIENDIVIGYELVHDFLSKKFFEKLSSDAQKIKTTIDIFRRAFKEWKQHGVLASKDRLEILLPNINQLVLNDEEWLFLIKSSFTVSWYPKSNKWIDCIEKRLLSIICWKLLQDKNQERIIEESIRTLAKIEGGKITSILIEFIESPEISVSIKETAIIQCWLYVYDIRIINALKHVITNNNNHKLRKNAVTALARNLKELSKEDAKIIEREIEVIYEALNDSKVEVRREAVYVLGLVLPAEKSISLLVQIFQNERAVSSRKSIISSLGSLLNKNLGASQIIPLLKFTSKNEKEDYRVREEARWRLEYYEKTHEFYRLECVDK